MACLFILLAISFTEQKSVNFVEIPFMIFFNGTCFCLISKKSLPIPRLPILFSILYVKKFLLFSFTFTFVIHFELFFVYDVECKLIFLAYRYFVILLSFVVKTIISSLSCLCTFVKNHMTICVSICV